MTRATTAVVVQTHRGDDCRGYQPSRGWEDFDEGLQRLNSEAPEDVPGLLDFEDGFAVFEATSSFGQRALAEGGTSGVAIEGDAVFLVADDPAAARAACLAAAGVDPAAYDIDEPVWFYAWTFFARR